MLLRSHEARITALLSIYTCATSGELWSITFAKMNPPLDGNSLVITTLDRVRGAWREMRTCAAVPRHLMLRSRS